VATYTSTSCSTRCLRGYLFIIALVWLVVISISVASVTLCELNLSYPIAMVCYLIGYLLIFIAIIAIYILRFVKIKFFHKASEKSKLELIVVTSFFLCWLPNWILLYGRLFLRFYLSEDYESFTSFVGYSHAWIMLVLLYFCDHSFRLHARKVFRCKEEHPETHKEQSTGLL